MSPFPVGRFLRVLALFALLSVVSGAALAALALQPGQDTGGARSMAGYYDESVAELTLTGALAHPELFQSGQRSHRLDAATRWLRLPVVNAGAVPGRWVLDLGIPDAELLEAYRITHTGVATLLAPGRHAPFGARLLQARMLALPIALDAGESADFLIRYRTHADTPLSLDVLTAENFQRRLAEGNLLNGAILGLLFALALFALLQYLMAGERAFLAYAGMTLASMAFLTQFEGYNFQYLWPALGGWNSLAPAILLCAIQATHVLFALALFDMRRAYPWLNRVFLSYLALVPVVLLLYVATGTSWPILVVGVAYVPLVFGAGIIFLRRGLSVAGLFLAGTAANTLFTNLLFSLAITGGLDLGVNPFLYPKIGYVCEALIFALALTRRLQALQQRVEDGLRRHLAETEQLARAEAEKHEALLATQRQQLQLAAAGHDLSQPLSSIRLALAALRLREGNETATHHIDQALDYTEALLRGLIDDARAGRDAGHQPVDLGSLLADTELRHRDAARRKGLVLRHRPSMARIDAPEIVLARILDNLVSNAVRYTERGHVLIGVRRRPDGLEIQVHDSGPGFDLARRKELLAPFAQGANAAAAQGHGLGLHIVRTLCEQFGYRLAICSRPGKGSMFGVLVPQA